MIRETGHAMTLSFMDSYILWRNLPFPRAGKNTALIATKSDLVDADEYVTTVIRFVERGIYKPAPVDVLEMLQDIMERTTRLSDELTDDDQITARFQHAYAALLDTVYRHFVDAGSSNGRADSDHRA